MKDRTVTSIQIIKGEKIYNETTKQPEHARRKQELDPNYPVSKGRVSGRVLGAADVGFCRCRGIGAVVYVVRCRSVLYVGGVSAVKYCRGLVAVV